MVLTIWELDHEEILLSFALWPQRVLLVNMISPLLLEDRKEEFIAIKLENMGYMRENFQSLSLLG